MTLMTPALVEIELIWGVVGSHGITSTFGSAKQDTSM